jgi:hypothetical protein
MKLTNLEEVMVNRYGSLVNEMGVDLKEYMQLISDDIRRMCEDMRALVGQRAVQMLPPVVDTLSDNE